MIHIPTFLGRTDAAHAAQLAVQRHEVDQAVAGAQMDQANGVVAAIHGAAEHAAIEGHGGLGVPDTQHDVVYTGNLKRHRLTPKGST